MHSAMQNLMQGRTSLIVASRVASMRSANKVVVVRGGKVEQCGTHSDLMAVDGLYRDMIARATEGQPTPAAAAPSAGADSSSADGPALRQRLTAARALADQLTQALEGAGTGGQDSLQTLANELKRVLADEPAPLVEL